MFFISCGWLITGVTIMLMISKGTMAVFIVPVFAIFYRLQLFYRRSAVDLQRLDAVSLLSSAQRVPSRMLY